MQNFIFRYLINSRSKKYLHVVDKFVKHYNNETHSGTGIIPNSVTPYNAGLISDLLYPVNRFAVKLFKFSIGQFVRISQEHRVFDKGYKPQFSEEVFKIVRRYTDPFSSDINVYYLEDLKGEAVKGKFYEQELIVVEKPKKIVKSVLKRKRDKVFANFEDYPESYGEWLNKSELKKRKKHV